MSMNLARCMDHGLIGCWCNSRLINVPSKLHREFWFKGERLVPESTIYARIHAFHQKREKEKQQRPGNSRKRDFKRISARVAKKWRARIFDRDDHTCKNCTSTEDLEMHHIHYDTFGHEDGSELITLCKWCHRDADRARERLRPHWERIIAALEEKWQREHPAA